MAEVLYRKYRSQTFDELIGQEHITDILKNSVKNDQISHAYLFVGSRGTGKTSSARILAKALNCTNLSKEGNPCNSCDSCKSITDGTFLDMIEIDAASNRGIDQIRELKERIEFSPAEGKFKVYIIDEVHMLTTEAFNALLKTLEEPPSHVIFILATTDVHKLPATILSRCQRYDFRLGTDKQIESVIDQAAKNEDTKIEADAMKVLVQNANGSYRDALSLLDVVIGGQLGGDKPKEVTGEEVRRSLGIPDSTMVYYLLEKLAEKDGKAALVLIGELDSKGVNLQQFVKFILLALREILIGKIEGSENEFSFAQELAEKDVLKMINLFIDAERKLRTATIPALVLEMVVAEVVLTEGNGVPRKAKPKDNPQPKKEVKPEKSDTDIEHDVDSSIEENRGSSSTEEFSSSAADEVDIDISVIESSWKDIVKRIQKYNGHLYAFLKAAKISQIENNFLILEVPFEFHKERIEAPKSREAINEILREVLGANIPIRCSVNETIQRKKPATADVVLKNIQQSSEISEKKETVASSTAPSNSTGPKRQYKKKISKKVEAIFADL